MALPCPGLPAAILFFGLQQFFFFVIFIFVAVALPFPDVTRRGANGALSMLHAKGAATNTNMHMSVFKSDSKAELSIAQSSSKSITNKTKKQTKFKITKKLARNN